MATAELKPGDRISEYVLEERVGAGGLGEVWRARHATWDDRRVAVKVPLDRELVRELKRAGSFQHRLDHPNIVRAIGIDPENDPPYLVMEYVEGGSLRVRLALARRLEPGEAVRIARQVLAALAYAHERGVVHGDLKPENILVANAGNVAKVTDFGLGRAVAGAAGGALLSHGLDSHGGGSISGTVAYMAPEQRAPGTHPIDARADVYAFGIVFFEMLTGARPEGGETPSEMVSGVRPELDDVFRRCYCRYESRFRNAGEALAALERAEHRAEEAQARVHGGAPSPRPSPRGERESGVAVLEVVGGRGTGRRFEIGSAVELYEGAEVFFDRGAWWIRDLGTRAGTYLKPATAAATGPAGHAQHERVGQAPLKLADGVRIVMKDRELVFRGGDPAPVTREQRAAGGGGGAGAGGDEGGPDTPIPVLQGVAALGVLALVLALASVVELGPRVVPLLTAFGSALVLAIIWAVQAGRSAATRRRAVVLDPVADERPVEASPEPYRRAAVAERPFRGAEPAGFLVRAGALLADLALFVFLLRRPWSPVVWILYDWLTTAAFGGTAGKWLLGLRVVDERGGRIGPGRALVRSLAKVISLLPLGLGFLLAGVTVSRQALHDFFAETRVVRDPSAERAELS